MSYLIPFILAIVGILIYKNQRYWELRVQVYAECISAISKCEFIAKELLRKRESRPILAEKISYEHMASALSDYFSTIQAGKLFFTNEFNKLAERFESEKELIENELLDIFKEDTADITTDNLNKKYGIAIINNYKSKIKSKKCCKFPFSKTPIFMSV